MNPTEDQGNWDLNCLQELENAMGNKTELYEIFRRGMSFGGSTFKIAVEDFNPDRLHTWPISETYMRFLESFPASLHKDIADMHALTEAPTRRSKETLEHLANEEVESVHRLRRTAEVRAGLLREASDWLQNPDRMVAYGVSLTNPQTWTPEERMDFELLMKQGRGHRPALIEVIESSVKPRLETAISALPSEEAPVLERHARNRLLSKMESFVDMPARRAHEAANESFSLFEEALAARADADVATIHPMRDGTFKVTYDSAEAVDMSEADTLTLNKLNAHRDTCRQASDLERANALGTFCRSIDLGKYDAFLPFRRDVQSTAAGSAAGAALDRLAGLPALQPTPLKPEAELAPGQPIPFALEQSAGRIKRPLTPVDVRYVGGVPGSEGR
jgi:hypothetical protein